MRQGFPGWKLDDFYVWRQLFSRSRNLLGLPRRGSDHNQGCFRTRQPLVYRIGVRGDRSEEFAAGDLIWVRLTHLLNQRVEGHDVSLGDLFLNLIGSKFQ